MAPVSSSLMIRTSFVISASGFALYTPSESIRLLKRKPKNARSKRAMEKREPKAVEDVKTLLCVRTPSSSANINTTLSQLHLLKKPDAIMFSNKNSNKNLHPFEDAASLEFWSQKNDTTFVMTGSHNKKRPNNLTLARMFNHQVLDMIELGVEQAKSMSEYKSKKPGVGQKPLFHFSGDLFDTHPVYMLFKSLILDLYRGEIASSVNLAGLEHVISISTAPQASSSTSQQRQAAASIIEDPSASTSTSSSSSSSPLIHFRVYMIKLLKSQNRNPYIHLDSCGPSFDFTLRRNVQAAPEMLKQATRQMKRKTKGEGGAAAKKRNKNWDTDAMGDKVGRLHVGKQDLSKLQARKMKGLKRSRGTTEADQPEAVNEVEMAT